MRREQDWAFTFPHYSPFASRLLHPFESVNGPNGLFTLHGTGNGTGNEKRWVSILHYVLYTLHRDRVRTANHCFLLCPSHSLSRSRSSAVCISHYVGTGLGPGPGPGPIKFNCFYLSSHISCSVKVKHKIMQAISSGPV